MDAFFGKGDDHLAVCPVNLPRCTGAPVLKFKLFHGRQILPAQARREFRQAQFTTDILLGLHACPPELSRAGLMPLRS